MRIYTRKGDDGSTGLFHGGRVGKDATGPEAYGTVDEAVSLLGAARSIADPDIAEQILEVQRDLFVAAAELATSVDKLDRLESGVSRVTQGMIDRLEREIDRIVAESGLPSEFVVPGGNPSAAALDVARSTVRRAERRSVTHVAATGADTLVVAYLNRLADYLFVLARAVERTWVPSRREEDR